MELIGLFRCYRKSVNNIGGKGMQWEEFVKEESEYRAMMKNWEVNIMILLIRIAVRDDATTQQIRSVCWRMGRRFDDKPLVEIPKRPGLGREGRRVNNPEINAMRAELLSVLNNKIWYNQVNQTYWGLLRCQWYWDMIFNDKLSMKMPWQVAKGCEGGHPPK